MKSRGLDSCVFALLVLVAATTTEAAVKHELNNSRCPFDATTLSRQKLAQVSLFEATKHALEKKDVTASAATILKSLNDTITCTFSIVCGTGERPLIYFTNVNGTQGTYERPWSYQKYSSQYGTYIGFSTNTKADVTFQGSVAELDPMLQWTCISSFTPALWTKQVWGRWVPEGILTEYNSPFKVNPPVLVSIACPDPVYSHVYMNWTYLGADIPHSDTPDYRLWDGTTGKALDVHETVTSTKRKPYRLLVWQIVTSVKFAVKFSCVAAPDNTPLTLEEKAYCDFLGTTGPTCWVVIIIVVLIALHLVLFSVMLCKRCRQKGQRNGLREQRGNTTVSDDARRKAAASEMEEVPAPGQSQGESQEFSDIGQGQGQQQPQPERRHTRHTDGAAENLRSRSGGRNRRDEQDVDVQIEGQGEAPKDDGEVEIVFD